MMLRVILSLIVLAIVRTEARPQYELCVPSDWFVGSTAFGGMGTLQAGSASTCTLSGLPSTWVACQQYTISVTSGNLLAHKIYAAQGTLVSGGTAFQSSSEQGSCRHTNVNKQTVSTYVWQAPADDVPGGIDLKALCGEHAASTIVMLSTANINRDQTTATFPSGCPSPTNSPTTGSPVTSSPTTSSPVTSSPVSSSPTTAAPTFSPTIAPTLSSPIGPDGLALSSSPNWRNSNITGVYKDLRLNPGAQITFIWSGQHSVVQYKSQADFDACAVANAVQLATLSNGGSYNLVVPVNPGTLWISCGVLNHCLAGQKVRVFVELAPMSPQALIPPPLNNWNVQTSYGTLTVQRGQEVVFNWDLKHSIVQFSNKIDFDNCDLAKASEVAPTSIGGSYTFRASHVGNIWLACSVADHCTRNMKLKIVVTPPVVGVDGDVNATVTNNWRVKSYDDLTVAKGTAVQFNWVGAHSVVQLNQDQFTSCSVDSGTTLVPKTVNGGTFTASTNNLAVGDSEFFACGVPNHCGLGQKVRIIADRVRLGPDAVFPVQRNNWRTKVYSDLRVLTGTDLELLWDGTHSVVQFSNRADFDSCNLGNAVALVNQTAGGSLVLKLDSAGEIFLGCGVAQHCASLGQKLRILVDADPAQLPTQAPVSGTTASPTSQGAAASSNNTGAIVGGISGLLIVAAAAVYRRSRSRSLSGDTTLKRTMPEKEYYNDVTSGSGPDVEAQLPRKSQRFDQNAEDEDKFDETNELENGGLGHTEDAKRMTLAPTFWSDTNSTRLSTIPLASNPSRTHTRSEVTTSTIPVTKSDTTRANPTPSTAYAEKSVPPPSVEAVDTFPATMAAKVDTLKRMARAQAGTLKKTFQEKRDIAMRSFRPIVALDVPVPPPPPTPPPSDSTTSQRSTFKPHPMYGVPSIKLPIAASVPENNQIKKASSAVDSSPPSSATSSSSIQTTTKPSQSMQTSISTTGHGSYVAPGVSKSRTFAPTASEMSSPDNFRDVASKIKQSVRPRHSETAKPTDSKESAKSTRKSRNPEHSSAASLVVIPGSDGSSRSGGNQSSSNPIFEALQEEVSSRPSNADIDEPEDANGVAKPYGSLRNHPLYQRTLSV